MFTLFPDIIPYVRHSLEVDPPHILYIEECGNPAGIPVVVLHGGPGAGSESYHRRFFDPERYRIILFDQRGCGRSTPHTELRKNTTQDLVADIERIREHLDIERWILFGGSWGTTLALVYAQAHPDRVNGMILRGIFLCSRREIEWFYQDGASRFFPEYWDEFLQPIPENERDDILHAYYRRLTGADELARMSAAKAWSRWEGRTGSLIPNKEVVNHFTDPYTALSMARIECHYFVNNAFLTPDQILQNITRISHIPTTIVHGRYDVICPLESAWNLHKAWPQAEFNVIANAGHSASEKGIIDALVKATHDFSTKVL